MRDVSTLISMFGCFLHSVGVADNINRKSKYLYVRVEMITLRCVFTLQFSDNCPFLSNFVFSAITNFSAYVTVNLGHLYMELYGIVILSFSDSFGLDGDITLFRLDKHASTSVSGV